MGAADPAEVAANAPPLSKSPCVCRGGDPTNKGKGGESIFGAENPISDEFSQELKHDRRGVGA